MSCLDFTPGYVSSLLSPIDEDVCGKYISPQLIALRQFETRAEHLIRTVESDNFTELTTFTGYSSTAKDIHCYAPVDLLTHIAHAMDTMELYIKDFHDVYARDTSIFEAAKMTNRWDNSYVYCLIYISVKVPESLPKLHIATFDSFKAFYHHIHKMTESIHEKRFMPKIASFLSTHKGEFERMVEPKNYIYNITTTYKSMQ